MKLYYVVGSGNCRKVLATINHLDLPIDIEYMDFFAGDLQRPDFLALNPNGRVPTMTDGDFVLWESNAIMQYVADKAGDNALFPRDIQTRADIVRWQCWELAHFNNAFATLAFETVLKPRFLQADPNVALVANAQENLSSFAKVLNGHLMQRDFLVGTNVTLADYAMSNLEAFQMAIPFDWKPYPAVNAYFERMRDDPAWAGTAAPTPESIGRKPAAA